MLPQLQDVYGAKEGTYASWGNKLAASRSWSVKDFFQTGYNTQHSLGLSIGGDKSRTYVSAGFADARGIVPNNDYRRYNVTANHSVDFLNDKLHLSILGMYMNVKEQNMLSGGQYYNPLVPLYLMSPGDDINKYSVYERYDASRNFPGAVLAVGQSQPPGTEPVLDCEPQHVQQRQEALPLRRVPQI